MLVVRDLHAGEHLGEAVAGVEIVDDEHPRSLLHDPCDGAGAALAAGAAASTAPR